MFFINNDDVRQILTIEDTLRVLEDGHRELARQELVARPRVDIYTETDREGAFHRWGTMEGASKGLHRHAIRMKSDVISWRDHGGGRVEDKYCVPAPTSNRGPRLTPGFRGRTAPLVDLIAGTAPGRVSDAEVSSSGGVVRGGGKQGLQFVTVASLVYDRARAAGLGREVPTEWFLQDIRD